MKKLIKSNSGKHAFTLVELIVVMALVSILAVVASISIAAYIHHSEETVCETNILTLQHAEDVYYNLHGMHAYSLDTLIQENLMPDREKNASGALLYCPNGGEFVWTAVPGSTDQKFLVCTFHGSTEILTPFGNDFTPISEGLIDAIQRNFELKGRYGRNWGDYAYTDIGLNPGDWGSSKPVNHIRYTAGGSNVSIRPEDGFTISVVSAVDQKTIRYMTAKLQWNITYDDISKKWYYHTISPENEIDINTMKVYK